MICKINKSGLKWSIFVEENDQSKLELWAKQSAISEEFPIFADITKKLKNPFFSKLQKPFVTLHEHL
jgi:hypothetical protein